MGVAQMIAQPARLLKPEGAELVVAMLILRAGIGLPMPHQCDLNHALPLVCLCLM